MIQQIQYNQRMINKLTLNDAVSKVYGKNLTPAGNPISDWQLFMPFSKLSTGENVLVKLLEVPAYLFTSQQICNKKIQKFNGILHEVKLIFIERCFQSSFYLLIAENNLIPISSILKIKKQAGEKVDESLIFDYMDFINGLHSHPYYKQIYFDQNDIGVTQDGKLMLANYLLYFQEQTNHVKSRSNGQCQFMKDAKNVLGKIMMNDTENIDWMGFYPAVEEKYGVMLRKVVQKFMNSEFNYSQVSSLITQIKKSNTDQSFSATITDTCVEQSQKMSQNLMNLTGNTNMIDESFWKIKKHKQSQKRKKIAGFIILFIVILAGIAAITFKYLKPRPLDCDESQYADQTQMKCLNCDLSCQSCSGSGTMMCSSCKPSMFLILKDFHDKVGKCGQVCHGTIIKTSTCIDNH